MNIARWCMIVSMKDEVVLVVGAHPDDPEFGCGGTTAKYSQAGAAVYYLICTSGGRGSRRHQVAGSKLIKTRQKEQKAAAKVLGVEEVFFLDHEDGNLVADIQLKEELVRIIRKLKPTKIFTHDPHWIYNLDDEFAFINHNDHRAAGEALLDAVYPLARDLASFPKHQEEGLEPHKVPEVYLFSSHNPNYLEDISDFFEDKFQAIIAHQSQVDDPEGTRGWMEKRLGELGKKANCKYAEGFIRLKLR